MTMRHVVCIALLAVGTLFVAPAGETGSEQQAKQILNLSGIQGGLVVHLGCGDGKLTANLRPNDSYLVHGLDRDKTRVEAARAHIRERGVYGPISVETFDGKKLPYAENLVNLLVVEDGYDLPPEECMRVLVPGGVMCVKEAGAWSKTAKPWPENIDEWTHYLHGPDNNAVANDSVVAPPKHIQWVAPPRWSRNHEFSPSIYGAVSAKGRLFYVQDEGPIGFATKKLPDRMSLVARDAFNGALLWKRPMKSWWTSVMNWKAVPIKLQRRLVAAGDRLFATLGIGDPIAALDAATGKTQKVYDGTAHASEIVYADKTLLLAVRNDGTKTQQKSQKNGIMAIDADTGKTLWEKKGLPAELSLCSTSGKAYAVLDGKVVCLDLRSGEEQWRGPSTIRKQGVLIAQDKVVLALGKKTEALSADSGKMLWTGRSNASFVSPSDAFVIDGLLWPGVAGVGLDLMTGQKKRSFKARMTSGHHHRCFMRKATTRYVLGSKRGVEFYDITGKKPAVLYDWMRGICRLGVVPCNGLLYLPPTTCRCYIEAQMHGFLAMAPGRQTNGKTHDLVERTERGTAADSKLSAKAGAEDWPTYRHDAKRSGSTASEPPTAVEAIWRAGLGTPITQPVVVGDRVFVAARERHVVMCLNAQDGKTRWIFTAGGRVDTPPTYYRGTLLFGSADGWVYSVDSATGKLRWRNRCAPRERRIGSFGQLESAWPVAGSILVEDNVAYAAAGRSSLVDGGIQLCALDAKTGKVLHRTTLSEPADKTGSAFFMPAVQSDVLVGDGKSIYLRHRKFSRTLEQQNDGHLRTGHLSYVRKTGLRLYTSSGFTDDSFNNRSYWLVGANYGNLMAFDDATTYGVKMYRRRPHGWSLAFTPEEDGYLLYGAPNRELEASVAETNKSKGIKGAGAFFVGLNEKHTWTATIPVRVQAMAVTPKTLWVAGPPDVIDPEDPLAAYEGRKGGLLVAFSKSDGKKRTEYKLNAPPAFDGLSIAGKCIYLALKDGTLVRYGQK